MSPYNLVFLLTGTSAASLVEIANAETHLPEAGETAKDTTDKKIQTNGSAARRGGSQRKKSNNALEQLSLSLPRANSGGASAASEIEAAGPKKGFMSRVKTRICKPKHVAVSQV